MADAEFAEFVAHEDFRSGFPSGRFRVVVNPKLARRYVAQRLMLLVIVTPVIGAGIALALTGRTWPGALLVAAGVVLNRAVSWQAPRILLHLVQRDRSAYEYATQHGVMEVRRRDAA